MHKFRTAPTCRALARTLLVAALTTLAATLTACAGDRAIAPGAPPVQADVSALAAPLNDDFDGAVLVTALPFTHTESTLEATHAADDPIFGCEFSSGPTVWYQFTPSEDVRVIADPFGGENSYTIGVFTGTRGALTEVGCSGGSSVVLDASAGVTYHFVVASGEVAPRGTLVLNVAEVLPVQVELTIDRFGELDAATNTATIHGTVTCSRHVPVYVEGVLSDRVRRLQIRELAFFEGNVECIGPSTWSLDVPVTGALLVPGPVEFTFLGYYGHDQTGESISIATEPTTVVLRRKG